METVVFSNQFGDIFDEKIYLKENKIEMYINYIKKFKLYCVYRTKIKFFFLSFSILVLLFSIFFINYLLLFFSFSLFIIVILYDSKKYYLKIKTKNINDDYILTVNKKKVNDAKVFVFEVAKYNKRINFDIEFKQK